MKINVIDYPASWPVIFILLSVKVSGVRTKGEMGGALCLCGSRMVSLPVTVWTDERKEWCPSSYAMKTVIKWW